MSLSQFSTSFTWSKNPIFISPVVFSLNIAIKNGVSWKIFSRCFRHFEAFWWVDLAWFLTSMFYFWTVNQSCWLRQFMITSIFYCTNSRGQLVEKVNVKVILNCHLENITLQYSMNAKNIIAKPKWHIIQIEHTSPTRFESKSFDIHFQDFFSILTWHRLYIIYSGLLFLNYLISKNLAAKTERIN